MKTKNKYGVNDDDPECPNNEQDKDGAKKMEEDDANAMVDFGVDNANTMRNGDNSMSETEDNADAMAD